MRFFCIYKPDPSHIGRMPEPEHLARIGKFIDGMVQSGVLLATEGFQPDAKDARVRLSNGRLTVTDGPFTEAKEVIGGFALLELRSREEAIENAKRFLEVMGGGESEIHQLGDAPNMPIERVLR
jgi:hypothetical protein